MKRGVLIPPVGTEKDKEGTSFFTYGDIPFLNIAPASILYWDKVYAPVAIRGMSPQYDGAVDRMVSLGIAESFDIKSENYFSSNEIPLLLKKYAARISDLNRREGEVWSVMPPIKSGNQTTSSQAIPFLAQSRTTMSSIEVTLKQSLPIPERSIPYEDILEFKLARRDQLARLHSEVSNISSRYINLREDRVALELSLNDLTLALSELQAVYSEKWHIRAMKNFSAAFAANGLWPAGVTYLAGAAIDTAFLAGAGATIVHTAIAASISAKHKDNPFSYAIEAQRL